VRAFEHRVSPVATIQIVNKYRHFLTPFHFDDSNFTSQWGNQMKSISIRQLNAGLALLRWGTRELAEAAGVSPVTIWRKTPSDGMLEAKPETIDRIMAAFNRAGIEFTNTPGTEGVRRRI
jgi:hypothetical protein